MWEKLQSTLAELEVEFFPGHLNQEEDSGPVLVTYLLKSPPVGDQVFQPMTLQRTLHSNHVIILSNTCYTKETQHGLLLQLN